MKVLLRCMHCLHENGFPDDRPHMVSVNDEQLFKMTCPNGHETLTVIQQPKHEVLFELGMNALVDGYPREAVTSFTSCLESFHKFCIIEVSLYKGVDRASLDHGWNRMAKQSERQLGAFVMLWLNYFGSAPALLNDTSRSFRNKVVHQGYIPEREEVLKFGDEIVACVANNLCVIQKHLGDGLREIFLSEYTARAIKQDQRVTIKSMPTTIDWDSLVQSGTVNLRDRLKEIDKYKVIFQ